MKKACLHWITGITLGNKQSLFESNFKTLQKNQRPD